MVNSSAALDAAFSALSDPTRRGILARLSEGERTVGELARPLPMSLPAVSKHLRVLEDAGLVARRREGRTHHVRLVTAALAPAEEWIATHRTFWESRFDGLERYLRETGAADSGPAPPRAATRRVRSASFPVRGRKPPRGKTRRR